MASDRRSFLRSLTGTLPASWVAFQTKLAAATSAANEDYWRLVKRQFPLADGLNYLNAANVCPSSRPVMDRHLDYLRDFHADPSFQNRLKYDKMQESLRSKIATMLGAEADEVAITRNTSEGSNIIVQGLDLKAGDEILITTHNHPSSNDSWKVRARRHGLVVKEAAVPIPARTPGQLLDSIAQSITAKTKLVAITHVTSTTGNRYPVEEIGRLAHSRGIWYHLDGAQTFGALDVNVRTIGCDSYAGSAHKWAMGPLETGALYIRKDRQEKVWPMIVTAGWSDNVKFSRKYEVLGQRDNPRIVAFEACIDFIQLIGMRNVETRLQQLVTHLKKRLAENPAVVLKTSHDWAVSGGVVKFAVKGVNTAKLYDALYRKHRIAPSHTASGESEGIRLSPHIYNTIEEMEHAAEAVKKAS